MNIGRQKTLLRRYGFDSSDPLLDWLNAALHEIESYEDWVWLEARGATATIAGNSVGFIPPGAFKLQSIRVVENNNKLIEYERTRFDREIFDPTVTGTPEIYVMTGMELFNMYPVPDAALELDITYYTSLDDMVDDDNASSPLPTRLHYPQVLCAAYIGLMTENEEERAGAAQKQYEASMSRIASRYDDRTDDEPQSVIDTEGYGCR